MEDIGQCFSVHEPMFDGDMDEVLRRVVQHFIQCLSNTPIVALDFADSRPVPGDVARQLPFRRVDAEREEPVELRMKREEGQRALADLVPIKGLEVAEVEDQPMALGNWALVERIGPDKRKQRVGARAGGR